MPDNIQFEEEQQYQQNQSAEQKPFFIRLVLSTGIVSTDEQAKYVLLGVAVLLIVIAFMAPSFIGGGPASPPPANQIIWTAGPGAVPGQR